MTTSSAVATLGELHDLVTDATGLTDFGDDDYREGLRILLDSYRHESRLTPMGAAVVQDAVRGALVARVLSEAAWQRHPEHADATIERPIFVTGLPRTGTTALHRLLTADPVHQGLEMWLTERPQPRPPRRHWESNTDFGHVDAKYRAHRAAHPDIMGMHFLDAAEVEECWRLLHQSMQSISFECLSFVPSYSAWLATQDWTRTYQRHRRNLQLIGSNDPHRRWVLKNPSHIFALDAIMRVYPDALIIHTHRAPSEAITSMCSVNAQATKGLSEAFDPQTIGRTQLDLWSRGLDAFTQARRAYNPQQFLDIDYRDFITDPMGTVANIYNYFDLDLTDLAHTAIQATYDESRRGDRKPSHNYSLGDFGLTTAKIDAKFPTH
ncbi:sulfotransferase family protein [Nocardia sp. CA-145437]|uniref:sulfotransferase family protein n=1 Tax=Nocardia sp. CA-145437 TaxID=3239980 RepID=UPI003D96E730